MARAQTITGGRDATAAVIPGRYALSVGMPNLPAPQGWNWTPLSSVARLESGHTPSRRHPEYWGGSIPWIGIRDATGNHGRVIHETIEFTNELGIENSSARVLPKDTVCLSRTASVGYVVVMGRPMSTSQDFVNWICSDKLNPHFLKYILLAEREALLMFAVGSVHQTIYFPEAKAFHICMPDRSIQDSIVEVLGALDEKIELNRRTSETLEAMARALFKDWFIDFGPTRAKMEGRAPYLASDIWSLFPENLDGEGKPESWTLGSMSDLLILQRGFDLPSQNRVDGPYPIIAASGPNGFHNAFMVKGPGVTTGRSGVLGNVFFVHEDFWPLNTSLWIKEFRRATPSYAYFYLQNVDFGAYNAGSAVPTLNRNHIHGLPSVIPSNALMKAFDQLALALLMRQENNRLESDTLAATRDFLLPKLMSGEVRVKEAEQLVGEAT